MINLQFFPSRRIALYMARLFVVRSFAVLVALVLVLMTLDLLGNSGEILAHPGNGDAELWRYVSLRVPQLVARFLPFSVLLGTLITLVALNQHSEIVTMKAAGISAHQIIAPLVLAGLAVAAANFLFNERFVTRANAAYSAWEAVEYGPLPAASNVQADVRVQHGEDLIFVDQIAGQLGLAVDRVMTEGSLYDRDLAALAAGLHRKPQMSGRPVPLVELDIVPAQQCEQFLRERDFLMMLLLPSDIVFHRPELCVPDTKG